MKKKEYIKQQIKQYSKEREKEGKLVYLRELRRLICVWNTEYDLEIKQ